MQRDQWYKIKSKPDVVILEGWCVVQKAKKNSELLKSINTLERHKAKFMFWRKYVNNQLKTNYKKMFKKLDEFVYLKTSNFKLLQKWRIVQEKRLSLSAKNKKFKNYEQRRYNNFYANLSKNYTEHVQTSSKICFSCYAIK